MSSEISPSEQKQLVTSIINSQAKKFSASVTGKSLEQEVTERADRIVGDTLLHFLAQREIKVIPTTMAQAVEIIHPMLKDALRQWSHEELLTLVSFQNSIIAAHNLSSELI